MRWAEKWVGRRFDPAGFNCWHLVRDVMRARKAIELPAYGETDARDLMAVARSYRGRLADPWARVTDAPRAFDVVVMQALARINGRHERLPMHAGIMISDRLMMHCEKGIDTAIVPITHPSVKFRLVAFYRHKDLA